MPEDRNLRTPLAMASFGKSNRTQTPVKGIINNDYGQQAEGYYIQRNEESFARVSHHRPT